MNCAEARDLLSAYYDGELSTELADDMALHVKCCAACQAELVSFDQLGAAMCCASVPRPAQDSWPCIAARLNEPAPVAINTRETIDASQSSSSPDRDLVARPAKLGGFRALAATILALAASLFFVVGLRTRMGGSAHQQPLQASSAVDYEGVFKLFEQQPQLAMETLSRRYQGREVSAVQAEAMLGYRPSIPAGLPSQTRLVSTRVLKLPQCKCAGGKCSCGPGECNCAACLCERPDGSKFVVLEQCKTQNVSFGDLPVVIARSDSRDVRFVRAHDQLAVSWIKDNRRLTAIGLKDQNEAEVLIATLGGA